MKRCWAPSPTRIETRPRCRPAPWCGWRRGPGTRAGSWRAQRLERFEGDVKELGGEVRKLADRVGAVETRLAVVEIRVDDLRRQMPAPASSPELPAEAPIAHS